MTKPAQLIASETKILYILVSFCFTLLCLYMYFVSASIVHVVERKESVKNSSALQSEIAKLEAEYMNLQHTVSSDLASQNGYIAIEDKIFLNRAPAVTLSYSR